MRRPLLLLAIFGLCANGLHARVGSVRASNDEAIEPKTAPAKPRRVLFRTDSPRLFAQPAPKPAQVKPPEQKPIEIKPEPTRQPQVKTVEIKPRRKAPEAEPTTVQTISFRTERPKLRTPIQPVVKPQFEPVAPPAPQITLKKAEPTGTKADLELQPTTFTPYDAYMGTVRSVIARLDQHEASMVDACALMKVGRRFRYVATDPYRAQPPSLTDSRQAGDCKSKALWLYDHLGDSSALYVIGKLDRRSHTSHAWLYWPYAGRWWILDPTDRTSPIAMDSVSASRYVPYYSYSRSGSFRHKATSLMLASNTSAPAAGVIAVRARSLDTNRR